MKFAPLSPFCSPRFRTSLGVLPVSLLLFAHGAWAQCSAPSAPGVRICTPTSNSVVEYVPAIAVNSAGGASAIQQFIIYVDGRDIYESQVGQTGINLYDASVRNGQHHLVVNAWDADGQLFQAQEDFTIIGSGYPVFCGAPSSPGINFCVPPDVTFQPTAIPISATATGASPITAGRIYVDGESEITSTGQNYLSTSVSTSPGKHDLTVVAWDSNGDVYSSSKTVTAYYGAFECAPKGDQCFPGIEAQAPQSEDYVDSSFLVEASVQDNPNPITAMRAYIDNSPVASSDGPVINQQIANAPAGTHILTIQAWDTAGNLYKIAYNINISVPH